MRKQKKSNQFWAYLLTDTRQVGHIQVGQQLNGLLVNLPQNP